MEEEIKRLLINNDMLIGQAELIKEYEFRITELPISAEKIKIKIYYEAYREDTPYRWTVSHFVKTPLQLSPYQSDRIFHNTIKEALEMAIDRTLCFIKEALRENISPNKISLVKNQNF